MKSMVEMDGEGFINIWPSMVYKHVVAVLVVGINSGGGGGSHCQMKNRNKNGKASNS
jgi:hypothetical protein